jgi:hypothetical protein
MVASALDRGSSVYRFGHLFEKYLITTIRK